MASGRLAVAAIPATTNTTVYTVPVATYTVCSVSITNRNTSPVTIRLAMASTGTPGLEEWIEYDTTIIANGVFERTGLVMQAGLNVVVYSSVANVGTSVYGIETSTA
tara:strand:+ start:84 stop:404 length:321 start_codon:yes stop_codon:yes gene_type:complete